jgi:hypothetical protein
VAAQVIELDVSKPWAPDVPARRGPPVGAILLMATVLVAILTGPALGTGRPFAFVWRTPTLKGVFWTTAEVLLTLEPVTEDSMRRVALVAREPGAGGVLWRLRLSGPLAETYGSDREALVTTFPPTFNQGLATAVIDSRTGATVRAYPAPAAPLAYVAGDVVLLIDREPRDPRAPVAPSSTRDNRFATGLEHTHLAEARDLRTGSVRWTRRLPAGTLWSLPGVPAATEGIVGVPPGEEWMVTFTYAGDLTAWDLGTGAPLARMALRPLSPLSYVTALTDAVLVRLRAGTSSQYTAYDMPRLQERWRVSPPDIHAVPFGCGPRLCLDTDSTVFAVDPGTGGVAWQRSGLQLRPGRAGLPVLVTGLGQPLARYDAATGQPLPADPSWRVADISPFSDQIVLTERRPSGGSALALYDIRADTVREFGVVPGSGTDPHCLAVGGVLACEQSGTVRVWHPG